MDGYIALLACIQRLFFFFFLYYNIVSDGLHQTVPTDVKADAEQWAKDALKESDSEDD